MEYYCQQSIDSPQSNYPFDKKNKEFLYGKQYKYHYLVDQRRIRRPFVNSMWRVVSTEISEFTYRTASRVAADKRLEEAKKDHAFGY
jgi:hypothetical protein